MTSAPSTAVEINKDFIQNGRVLVKGSPIHGSNGLAFDTQDRLHIASVMGREIIVMDPRMGKILDRLFALNLDRVVQIDPDTGAGEEVAHVGHGLGYPRSTQLGSLLSIHNAIRRGGFAVAVRRSADPAGSRRG